MTDQRRLSYEQMQHLDAAVARNSLTDKQVQLLAEGDNLTLALRALHEKYAFLARSVRDVFDEAVCQQLDRHPRVLKSARIILGDPLSEIRTVSDLLNKTEADLKRVPNAGPSGLELIKDVLALHGLKLRE